MNLKANIFQVKAYLRYKSKAQGRHGTHSPLVYEFVDNIIPKKINSPKVDAIEKTRKALLSDHRTIDVRDLGQGSHHQKGNERKLKDIAKYALSPQKDAALFYKVIQRFRRKSILELGTSLGITSLYFSATDEKTKVVTLEGCPQTAACARENFTRINTQNITLREGDFDASLQELHQENEKFDLIYIDGNHNQKATLRYLETILKISSEDAIFIFDDIYWSADMENAWQKIVKDERFSLSLDFFNFGMVFRDVRPQKEHFILRYA